MVVWKVNSPLDIQRLPVSLKPVANDWWGQPVEPAPRFTLIEDPGYLWLVAFHEHTPRLHPGAGCGEFLEGLWEFDVAECFIAGPEGYLEFNLSPTGAWWCARFSAPRVRDEAMPRPRAITRVGSRKATGGWLAALGIPLEALRREAGWDDHIHINVTFIVGEPQRFLTVADLGEGQPDFHRPEAFAGIDRRDA